MELQTGEVYQTFANGEVSGPYLLKGLPWGGFNGSDYWCNRVNLYTKEGKWNHTAHISTLSNQKPLINEQQELRSSI